LDVSKVSTSIAAKALLDSVRVLSDSLQSFSQAPNEQMCTWGFFKYNEKLSYVTENCAMIFA